MKPSPIIVAGTLLAGVVALGVIAAQPKVHGYETNTAYHGIPSGIMLKWDNGLYVPVSVPSYESVADYPDTFWLTPAEVELDSTDFKKI